MRTPGAPEGAPPPSLPGGGPIGGGTPPGLNPPTPGGGGSDNGGGKVCVVSLLTSCGTSPAEGGNQPDLFTPGDSGPNSDLPPPGGGDPPPSGDSGVAGGVPEPASWLIMILGFGALGTTVRAQRRKARGLAA